MVDRIQNRYYDIKRGNNDTDSFSPISSSIQMFSPISVGSIQNGTNPFLPFSSMLTDKFVKSDEKTVTVGDFKQGYTNDCWLLAAIKSLSLSPSGKQQLNEMIKINDDNTYTVTFANGKKFNISENELKDDNVKLANGKDAHNKSMVYINNVFPYVKFKINPNITYSKGDKYTKLIEIAANKYVHELSEKAIKEGYLQHGNYTVDNYPLNETDIFGDVSHYITKDVDISKLSEQDILYIATHSDSWINNLKNKGISHHAYSVKFIDKENKKIHLINPHNTKEEPLIISFDDFYKRYAMIALRGNYKETASKTNIEYNINNSDFEQNIINIVKSLGVKNFDACFVATGDNFQSSLEITSQLYENGANYIVSKASDDMQVKFLMKLGANEVIFPEHDMADRLAQRFNMHNVFNYIEISNNLVVYETGIDDVWIGKSIVELDIRKKYQINVLAIARADGVTVTAEPGYIFEEGDLDGIN